MAETKAVAASIVNFLKRQLENNTMAVDSRESLEVGVQCIETAFQLAPEDSARATDLLQLTRGIAPASRAEAEALKNEGNELMKVERHREALDRYSRAIEIDPRNSVFFCNRAAAHFRLGEHEAAVADCKVALALAPDYGKAHGRMGLALTALERHREARDAYVRASQLEPENESYRQNLRLAEERLAAGSVRPSVDLAGLLQNPALLSMASEMLTEPNMQNLISGLMGSNGGPLSGAVGSAPGAGVAAPGGMGALLEAGQALAQHMQAANPELVEQLRRQMRAQPPAPPAPPSERKPEM